MIRVLLFSNRQIKTVEVNNLIKNRNVKIAFSISVLFAITLLLFKYSLEIRKPWFGTLSESRHQWFGSLTDGHHQWLTGSTLKFSKNWYREGIINLKFLMLEKPRSIESPTLISREPYVTYPPGAIIPVSILAKLMKQEPTPAMIMGYNLVNHFFIAFTLSLIIFFFLLSIDFDYRLGLGFSLIPIFLELLMPGPLYWHQNVFFADQAVILPFVVFVFLEVIRDLKRKRVSLSVLQGLVMFWGLFTEPSLFIFVALITYFKRLFLREYTFKKSVIAKSLTFWIPVVITGIIYFYVPYSLNLLPKLFDKFLYRTALNSAGKDTIVGFSRQFWKGYFMGQYGDFVSVMTWSSLLLILITFFYVLYDRYHEKKSVVSKIAMTNALITIVLFPCFAQIYFFRNHSAVHDFSVLKFSVPVALTTFVLTPILMVLLIQEIGLTNKIKLISKIPERIMFNMLLLVCFLAAAFYIKRIHPNYQFFFPRPNNEIEMIGTFIDSNTEYKDIVFSPTFEILIKPPQLLSHSMKLVYKINSASDIHDKIKYLKEDFDINLFLMSTNQNSKYIRKLIKISYISEQNDEMLSLYKIKKDTFLKEFSFESDN